MKVKKDEITKLVDPVFKTKEQAERDRKQFEEDLKKGRIQILYGNSSSGKSDFQKSKKNYYKKTGSDYIKGANAVKHLLPIFSKDKPSDLVEELLREDEEIRRYVIKNPEYKHFLEQKAVENFKKYGKVLRGAKIIDSWDRVTSSLGVVADVAGVGTAGIGNIVSLGEEVVELIPKSIYAVYYGAKTKDFKGLAKFAAAEAASFIPFLGDFIDLSNIYVNRARKFTKEKTKKDFKKLVKKKSSLEKKVINY
jgi:hypothetical protein